MTSGEGGGRGRPGDWGGLGTGEAWRLGRSGDWGGLGTGAVWELGRPGDWGGLGTGEAWDWEGLVLVLTSDKKWLYDVFRCLPISTDQLCVSSDGAGYSLEPPRKESRRIKV